MLWKRHWMMRPCVYVRMIFLFSALEGRWRRRRRREQNNRKKPTNPCWVYLLLTVGFIFLSRIYFNPIALNNFFFFLFFWCFLTLFQINDLPMVLKLFFFILKLCLRTQSINSSYFFGDFDSNSTTMIWLNWLIRIT